MSKVETKVESYLEENEEGIVIIKQEYYAKLKALRETKESVERELKALSNSITEELKTRFDTTTKVNDYNFVVKGGYFDFVFDEERFKEENIELYIKYLVPHENKQTCVLVSARKGKQ